MDAKIRLFSEIRAKTTKKSSLVDQYGDTMQYSQASGANLKSLFHQVIHTAGQWLYHTLHLQPEEQGSELSDGDPRLHAEDIQLQVVGLLQLTHDG